MGDLIYRIIGRASLLYDWFYSLKNNAKNLPHEDLTGVFFPQAQNLEVLWDDPEVLFVHYDSLSHSLWRSQEFSLFRQYRTMIQSPAMDFGCGDGTFASMLFKRLDYGVDRSEPALERARSRQLYKNLILSSNTSIPLEKNSVKTIVSNSVLEHTVELDQIFMEFHRILMSEGVLIITVPVVQYKEDLAKYFGEKESVRINDQSFHNNLFSPEEWKKRLEKVGFSILVSRAYQPDWFTFWYRMFRLFGSRLFVKWLPWDKTFWKLYGKRIVTMVSRSIRDTAKGGNILIIAKKG